MHVHHIMRDERPKEITHCVVAVYKFCNVWPKHFHIGLNYFEGQT